MPYKCSAGICRSNYKGEKEKVKIYPFPSDPESIQMWVNALVPPNKLTEVTVNMAVCIKYWPENQETFLKKGKVRPVNPPHPC